MHAGLLLLPLRVDGLSLLTGALPCLTSGVWCDLAISAWQHGSDAVKCHFAVAHRGSKLLQGLFPWWWETNGTTILVKDQATRFMHAVHHVCIHFKYEGNIFILFILLLFQCFCKCENNGRVKIIWVLVLTTVVNIK